MNFLERLREVHTFIFDVDGVMTNSEVIVLENGRLLRKMNVRDGYALKMAVRHGYNVCIITGGKSSGVVARLEALGIIDIYKGIDDKLEAFDDYVESYDLDPNGILYMGDDIADYAPMRRAGITACPLDAVPEIVKISQFHSPIKGGEGCVRDIIEKVMKLHGKWMKEDDGQANSISDQSNF